MQFFNVKPPTIILIFLLVGGLVMFIAWTSWAQFFPGSNVERTIVNLPTDTTLSVPGTQPAFYELTIPGLRERSYQSQLGTLEEFSQNSNYTTYLTSYTSDGLRINGLLTLPSGQQPVGGWPAIVFIHGYIPPTQYRTTEKYEDYVDYLARSGFVVFKTDLRGHGESEGQAGGAYFSADYVVDALNAYSALQSADFVNQNQVGLWGHSMAGNVVLRTMAAKPEIPAGVIWAGAVYSYADFAEFGISDNSYRPPSRDSKRQQQRDQLFAAHGRPGEPARALDDPGSQAGDQSQNVAENAFWQQVAPTSYLQEFQGAVQLHHATNDDVVNIAYTRDLESRLAAAGVTHEVFEYQSGGHNISGASFSTAMQRTVDFFTAQLK